MSRINRRDARPKEGGDGYGAVLRGECSPDFPDRSEFKEVFGSKQRPGIRSCLTPEPRISPSRSYVPAYWAELLLEGGT